MFGPGRSQLVFVGVLFIAIQGGNEANSSGFYWTEVVGAAGSHSIMKASDDGSGISTVVGGLRHPRGLTLDLQHRFVYWAEPGALRIARTSLDGNGPIETVVPTDNGSADVALDLINGKMYWTDSDNDRLNFREGRIRRANLDGSQIEDIINQNLRHPAAIALDVSNNKVYWTDLELNLDGLGSIQRSNLDGSNVETIVTGVDEANLAIDTLHGKIYWTELSTDRIQRANLDGSDIEDVLIGLDNPVTIDVDGSNGKIYWTGGVGIERANVDGTNREVLVLGIGRHGIAIVPEPSTGALVVFLSVGVSLPALRRRSTR